MSLPSFLQLIRWKNVALMAYLLILLNWVMIPRLGGTALDLTFFILFSVAVLFILAGGNCINDVFDCEIDKINKPNKLVVFDEKSEAAALKVYKTLNVIGICAGIWFSMQIAVPGLSLVFIGSALLLYFYSKKLKFKFLLGNVLVSSLVMLPIIILSSLSFDFIPIEIAFLSYFVFLMSMVREIIKDCQDVKGDYKFGGRTLPIVLGISRTIKIVQILLGLVILTLVSTLYLLEENTYLKLYILILLVLPLIWMTYKMNPDKRIWNFQRLSNQVKWLFFIGINSIYFI